MTVGKPWLYYLYNGSYVKKQKTVFSSFNGVLSYNFEFGAEFFLMWVI